jgi:hypothetical protein
MIDPMTLYVLIGGVLVIFVGLGLRQLETLQKTVPLWLWSALAGIMVGAGVAAFAVHKVESLHKGGQANESRLSANSATGSSIPSPMGGPMAGGPGGGRGGGAPSGGPGGGSAPRSRRDLTALIGKLEILTRGLHLDFDAEQKTKLALAIEAIDKDAEMTEEAAKEYLDTINEILTAEHADVLASIELPRAGRAGGAGGPGGQGGPGGAMARPSAPGGSASAQVVPVGGSSMGIPGMGPGGGGGGNTPSNDNPFKQEDNAKRLNQLRERISSER